MEPSLVRMSGFGKHHPDWQLQSAVVKIAWAREERWQLSSIGITTGMKAREFDTRVVYLPANVAGAVRRSQLGWAINCFYRKVVVPTFSPSS